MLYFNKVERRKEDGEEEMRGRGTIPKNDDREELCLWSPVPKIELARGEPCEL